ncbi:hypothetical protein NB688_003016 [Xanthomonas sacchari]|uniref:Uncharacterized protein n=1 Tax=Xanthomonas sacchari TaxID=56458 RepID=A0ABT3DYT4_9XANT|nr:hypothetical protein [Xanthomonas sacchari]MCW0400655.1 hypothetical protein [Xanthomonas sacchari]MCW0420850.1 hypothetical protein [Xanthomonas sacchari]
MPLLSLVIGAQTLSASVRRVSRAVANVAVYG